VKSAGEMKPCAANEDDQLWSALHRAAVEGGNEFGKGISARARAKSSPPNCGSLADAAFKKLDVKREFLATDSTDDGHRRRFFYPEFHIGPGTGRYRSFADLYQPTPLGYLEWIYRSERRRNTARFNAMEHIFAVQCRQQSWSNGKVPKHVFSWALSLKRSPQYADGGTAVPPRSTPAAHDVSSFMGRPDAPDVEKFGPRLMDDKHEKKEILMTEAEAKSPTDRRYHGGNFFDAYCQPMIVMIGFIEANLEDWGVVLHIGPSLAWLAPLILGAGKNIEVVIMKSDGIRTAMSLWRWLPFDDTRFETVLALDSDETPQEEDAFAIWPAVLKFTDDDNSHAMMRWMVGGGRKFIAKNSHIRPHIGQYAVIQGNIVGNHPRMNTHSWHDSIVAFALHRLGFPEDHRPWPHALRKHINPFNRPIGSHKLGWGRQLFDYGFDEYYLKTVPYMQTTVDGTGLFSAIPQHFNGEVTKENRWVATLYGTSAAPDKGHLRCRNAYALDAMWMATHLGNAAAVVSSKYGNAWRKDGAVVLQDLHKKRKHRAHGALRHVDFSSLKADALECGLSQ